MDFKNIFYFQAQDFLSIISPFLGSGLDGGSALGPSGGGAPKPAKGGKGGGNGGGQAGALSVSNLFYFLGVLTGQLGMTFFGTPNCPF